MLCFCWRSWIGSSAAARRFVVCACCRFGVLFKSPSRPGGAGLTPSSRLVDAAPDALLWAPLPFGVLLPHPLHVQAVRLLYVSPALFVVGALRIFLSALRKPAIGSEPASLFAFGFHRGGFGLCQSRPDSGGLSVARARHPQGYPCIYTCVASPRIQLPLGGLLIKGQVWQMHA